MRPTKEETFLDVATTLSRRSTCARRSVGCVLVDDKQHIIGTGYNGVGRGLRHCTDVPCSGAAFASGKGLDVCQAIHAEQNALMQCSDVHAIHAAYVTCSPCIHCAKLFLNTSVKEIVTREIYDLEAISLLQSAGIIITMMGE